MFFELHGQFFDIFGELIELSIHDQWTQGVANHWPLLQFKPKFAYWVGQPQYLYEYINK